MNASPQTSAKPLQADDEIDLGQLAASLGRRRRLIAVVTGGTVILTGLLTLLQKPVWEGEFQIVLASQDKGVSRLAQLAAANPMLAGVAMFGSGGGRDSLETEVKILESPSVLKPVFDFVRTAKIGAGENVNQLQYETWARGNLDVKLEKGTSILNISYRDADKQLVLPVIKKISKTYQNYSGRDRRRDIAQAVNYLTDRIATISPQGDRSMRQAQAFALSNGLGIEAGMPTVASVGLDGGGSAGASSGSVEANRLMAQAQVITLRQQIRNAEAAGAEVLFQAPQLEANKDLYRQYQILEATLAEPGSRLREKDPIIVGLLRQRSALINSLNRETISLLQSILASTNAKFQAASRPKKVVLQHRQLVRQALRDEKTLIELENQLQLASLEQAKQTDPWELISNPTLLDRPVAPKKGRNLALGLLAGLVLVSGAALVAERRPGRIHGSDILASLLPSPLLAVLEADQPAAWSQPLQLLSSGPLAGASTVALVTIGMAPDAAEPIAQALQLESGRPVICSSDLVATRNCDAKVLLTNPGAAERDKLQKLRRDLETQASPVVGWLLLSAPRPMAESLPLRSRRWANSALVVATLALQPVQAQPSWQAIPAQQLPGGQPAPGLPQWQRIIPDPIPGSLQGSPIWQPLPGAGAAGPSRQLVWQPVAPVAAESKPGIASPGAKPGRVLPQTWTRTTSADPLPSGSANQAKPIARPPTSAAEAQALLDGLKPTAADFTPQLRLGEAVPTAQQLGDQQGQFSVFQLAPLGGAKQGGGGGTGNQNYAARLDAGITDQVQISAFYSVADDPLYAPITGKTIQPANFWESYGGALQWRLLGSSTTPWKLALAGSLEGWTVGSGGCDSASCKGQNNASPNIFNTSGSRVLTTNMVGSLALPITWQALPTLALSFTPGVSFLPGSQGASQGGSGLFYGNNISVAAGASWRPIPSLTLFGSGLIPLGPGNNSFDGNLVFARVPIVTAGINWALNPLIALEGQLSNGWGATPATALLALPSDNRLGYSARFVFTPGGLDSPQPAMTDRQRSLALGGLTVNTALVPPRGTTQLWANGDSQGNGFGSVGYSLSNRFQLDGYQGGAFNNVRPASALASTYASDGGWNYRFGGKAIAMSQLRGAPFSLGGRISLGRNTDPSSYQGYVFAESVSTWEANSWLALNLNPKLAWSGISTPWALGLGANIQLGRHFQLIPELNVVGSEINASNGTLALRWLATSSTNLEVYVSNAAGLFDIGQLLDNSTIRVGSRLLFSF